MREVQDKPGVAAAIFGPLADANINVDMIVQIVSADGDDHRHHLHRAGRRLSSARWTIIEARRETIGYAPSSTARTTWRRSRRSASACASIPASPRGRSRRSPSKRLNIRAITTSEIKFSMLIDEAYTELAVRTLHTLYGLDAKG